MQSIEETNTQLVQKQNIVFAIKRYHPSILLQLQSEIKLRLKEQLI